MKGQMRDGVLRIAYGKGKLKMNKEDCIVGTRVAILNKGDFEIDNKIAFGVIKAPPQKYKQYNNTASHIVEVDWEEHYTNAANKLTTTCYRSTNYVENLMTEEAGKKLEAQLKIKQVNLADEFNAVKKQVIQKAEAAAILIKEANQLLSGNRELCHVGGPEIYHLQAAIRDGGWCTSDHNC